MTTVNRRLNPVYALILILLLALGAQTARAAEPEIIEATLPNGLKVIIEEEHSAPVAAVQMWVRVGSADESESEAGLSHVFEHMLFKGTERRGVGELAREVESVGGGINAYTSFDNTVYHLTVPSRHFEVGLDVIADAVQNSAFDPDELSKELEVVLEEMRMNEDRPGRNLFKALLANTFTTHPYRRMVIGSEEVVSNLTRADTLRFKKKYYRPNNMTLVIVGDVDGQAALEMIKGSFKGFRKGKLKRPERPAEPPQEELRATVISKDVKETHFGMAFHIPSVADDDIYAVDVAESILSGGLTSRLVKRLRVDEQIVHGVSAYAMTLKDPGVLFITGTAETEKVEPALTAIVEEITRLGAEGPTAEELERTLVQVESSFVYSRETMQGIAGKLGYFQTLAGDIAYEEKYLAGIRAVTASDVMRVVEKYLARDNLTVAVLLPEPDGDAVTADGLKETVTAAYAGAEKRFGADGEKIEADGDITKVTLDSGITLLVKEVHANPTVAMYAAFPGGLRFETAEKNGISSFAAGMLSMGTKNYTREELAREVEDIAGGVGGFSGWNSTGASGKFLSRHFDKGLGLLAEIIKNPVFPEEEMEKNRVDTMAAIKRRKDNVSGYTFQLLYDALYTDHPYGMTTIGTEESINSLSRDDLIAHHRRFFTPSRMVLTVVGDVDTSYVVERVKAHFADFTGDDSPLAEPEDGERPDGVVRTGEVMDKAQTHMGIGFLGTTITSEDRYALSVLSEVLSGQGGRLFVNLRDKKSLAYSVGAVSKEAVDPGVFVFYIATAPEKKDEAMEAIINEIELLKTESPTEEEILRAKNSLIGSFEIGLQEVSAQATNITYNELYGLGHDFNERYPELVEAVDADDLTEAAGKYFTLDSYVISVVGPNGFEDGGAGEK